MKQNILDFSQITITSLLFMSMLTGCISDNDDDSFSRTIQDGTNVYDTFDQQSLRYTVDQRPDDRVERTYLLDATGLVMTAAATGEDRGSATLHAWDTSDLLQATVSISKDTQLEPGQNGFAQVGLGGFFFNDLQDGGTGAFGESGDSIGDVFINLEIIAESEGSMYVQYCANREGAEGDAELLLFDGFPCARFDEVIAQLDTEYELLISVDRENGMLRLGLDDTIRDVALPTSAFLPYKSDRMVRVMHQGDSGQVIGTVHGVTTDIASQDFTLERPTIGHYQPIFNLQRIGNSAVVVDGKAVLRSESTSTEDGRLSIHFTGSPNRVEAAVAFDETTVVPAERTAMVQFGGTFYNDTQNGGFDGSTGNVYADVRLVLNSDGTGKFLYCAFRSNDESFGNAEVLIGTETQACAEFERTVTLGEETEVSISIDRTLGRLFFTVADERREYDIVTPHFLPDEHFLGVRVRAETGASAVVLLDYLRTDPAATPIL